MKNVCLLLLLQVAVYFSGKGQIICVHCFEQNEAISSGFTNQLLNGGFETTTCTPAWFQDCFCPNSTLYNCDLSNWTCTGGDASSYPSVFDNTLSIIPEGNNAAYFGNGNAFACSEQWGDPSCYVVDMCTRTGIPSGYPRSNPGYGDLTGVSLEQTVSGLIVGHTYVLEFWAGGEPLLGLLTDPSIFAVDVGFGKIFLTCKPTGEPDNLIGTRYLVVFNANAPSHQIKFTNWGHICDVCTEVVLDDVSLYTIEELSGTVPECTTAAYDQKETNAINIYPNPFNGNVLFTFDLIQSGEVSLEIYDLNGRKIESLIQDHLQAGMYEQIWNADAYPAGVYYYRLISGSDQIFSGHLISMR